MLENSKPWLVLNPPQKSSLCSDGLSGEPILAQKTFLLARLFEQNLRWNFLILPV